MTRVLIVRTGSVWWLDTTRANPTGEQNDATGVARMLRDQGYDVAITGRIEGELDPGEGPPVTKLDWNWKEDGLPGNAANSTAEIVYAAYDKALARIEAWKPDVILEIAGAAPTMSTLDNHKGNRVFEFSVRYYGMALYMYRKLKLPRLLILNDPRSYPKDQEMTRWPECIPQAVLSQYDEVKTQVVDGVKYNVEARYAGCENWWSWGWEYAPLNLSSRSETMTIIAHSHLDDSRLKKYREDVWSYILDDPRLQYKVFGKNWDYHPMYDSRIHRGPVKPDLVHELLQKTVGGPMIPISDGWLTAKMRQYLVNGAVPMLYGRGDEVVLKYDKRCIHVADSSSIRFSNAEELHDLWRKCISNRTWRKQVIECYREETLPDAGPLIDLVDHFARGGQQDMTRFGGYNG